MLNHVLLMKFKAGVTTTQIDALEEALDVLPNTIIEIQMLELGRDVTGSEHSYDFAVVALVANPEALDRFYAHPDFLTVKSKMDMMCENIVTVDFEGTDASDLGEKLPVSKLIQDFRLETVATRSKRED